MNRRKYEADVFYEVWSQGGDPDAIDYDRVDESFYCGNYYEEAAEIEVKSQNKEKEPC